jgi:acyl-coenzyme A thioesterase PaaI-like protein
MHLSMHYRRGVVYTNFNLSSAFEGYEDVVQGGMLFGILDAIMWYVIFLETGRIGMTRKTDMDFLKPVECGPTYRAEGKLVSVEDRDIRATAWIDNAKKERCAQMNALFREAQGLDYAGLFRNFDFTGISPKMKKVFLSRSSDL